MLAKQTGTQRRPELQQEMEGYIRTQDEQQWAEGAAKHSDLSSIWLPRPLHCASTNWDHGRGACARPHTHTPALPILFQLSSGNGRANRRQESSSDSFWKELAGGAGKTAERACTRSVTAARVAQPNQQAHYREINHTRAYLSGPRGARRESSARSSCNSLYFGDHFV